MAWLSSYGGLTVLLFCFGAFSQAQVTQSGPVSVGIAGTTVLTCALQGVEFISPTNPSWYQHKEGKSPRLLIYKSRERASGTPQRFSADTYGNTAKLTISSVEVGDEGDYYCAVWHNSGFVFGSGTQLTVTGQPTVSPSVQVFAPSPEEIRSLNPHTVVCLLSNFYPPSFVLQWKCDDKVMTSGVETTKATKQGDKYLASSYLKLSASDYERYGTFTCEVTHERKTIVKTVSKSGSC